MSKINIRTTLGVCAPRKVVKKLFSITRGASARFNFNIADKIYDYNDIDQITFIFKESGKKAACWYSMFDYIKPTQDTEVDPYKIYYKDVRLVSLEYRECIGTKVTEPEGNPAEQEWYEVYKLANGEDERLWILDDHFTYDDEMISLIMRPNETAAFKCNDIDSPVQFEIVIRLDTDNYFSATLKDSILIEPQPGLLVMDSLYSQISDDQMVPADMAEYCSEVTCCSERLVCK